MAKIIILGSGLVGNVMAKDLAEKHDVTSVDINEKALIPLKKHGISTIVSDLSNPIFGRSSLYRWSLLGITVLSPSLAPDNSIRTNLRPDFFAACAILIGTTGIINPAVSIFKAALLSIFHPYFKL